MQAVLTVLAYPQLLYVTNSLIEDSIGTCQVIGNYNGGIVLCRLIEFCNSTNYDCLLTNDSYMINQIISNIS